MKKIILLVLSFFVLCATCLAAPAPNKHIVLMYKVPNSILMCQNSNEDMVAGAQEFEKELKNHYSNRFIVDGVKRLPLEPKMRASEYLAMVKANQIPFILVLQITGTGNKTVTYSNMFGGTISTIVPTIKIKRNENIVDRLDNAIYGVDYNEVEYNSNTMAVGREIYSNTDIRKNTKNCIRGYIRDYCMYQGDKINKYADPGAYSNYTDSYGGNFKAIDEKTIEARGNKAYLGFSPSNCTIISITSGGPIDVAGAKINDVLESINDEKINSEYDLTAILGKYKQGDHLKIKVLRDGKEITLNVVAGVMSIKLFTDAKV